MQKKRLKKTFLIEKPEPLPAQVEVAIGELAPLSRRTKRKPEPRNITGSSIVAVDRRDAKPGDITDIQINLLDNSKVRYEVLVEFGWLPLGHFYADFHRDVWQLFCGHKIEHPGHEVNPKQWVFTYTPFLPAGTLIGPPYTGPMVPISSSEKIQKTG